MPKYGASVKMEDFGSKFFLGKIYEKIMEPPLHFIQGNVPIYYVFSGNIIDVLQRLIKLSNIFDHSQLTNSDNLYLELE